jgi:hypothetical protein
VEDGGVTACEEDAMAELSRGTEAASCYLSVNADTWFTYAVDGEVLVSDESLIPDGTEPPRLAAALAAAGVAGPQNDEAEGDDFGLHERVVCALAGLQLTAADFRGRPLLAAPRG